MIPARPSPRLHTRPPVDETHAFELLARAEAGDIELGPEALDAVLTLTGCTDDGDPA